MKTRHFVIVAISALLFYVLGSGCTQDFGVFTTCSTGTKLCGGGCVDPGNPQFGCTADGCTPCSVANATATCQEGLCAIEACTGSFQNCDGAKENGCEVDPTTDPANCGACGNACIVPHAQANCSAGKCGVGTCDPGFEDCNGDAADGCEADTQSDPDHCGDCATNCPGNQQCVAGKCTLVCPDGKGDCDNDPANGCETDFGTTLDCAFCGDMCNLANAAASCTNGKCVVENCQNPFGDCDGVDANGCEADLDNSAMTCGTCNNACPNGANGTAVCDNGTCDINCNAGFDNCDNNLGNGCEADVSADDQNCGACGQKCTIANGTGACTGGMCMVTGCNGTFADCNMMAADGCEANKNNSVANCGMCGNACNFPNAAATCNGGTCQMGMCNAGFGNCDGMTGNGCEKVTSNDVNNCGTCGNVCPSGPNGTPSCTNGMCGFNCAQGFGNCDGNLANGCESNLASDPAHCGSCVRPCAGDHVAAKSCTGGVCDSTCDLGFGNCNMPMMGNDDGCETGTAAGGPGSVGKLNCGGCGNACAMQGGGFDGYECDQPGGGGQQFCGCSSDGECNAGSGGTCALGLCTCGGTPCKQGEACTGGTCSCNNGAACGAGQACCVAPAGCQNLQTDPQSCGACGHKCAAGFACTAGVCGCDADADCDAGGGATSTCTVASGLCKCGNTTCGVGERCLANGTCG